MSKIDYSQFYMKNYMPKKEDQLPKKPRLQIVRSGRKQTFTVVIIVIIIFALILVNLKLAGYSFDSIKNIFAKSSSGHDYYLLVKEFNQRDRAYAQSLLVRQSGAGGYVYQDKGKYIVVYAVYLDKQDAENVAQKNLATEVRQIDIEQSQFNNQINTVLKELIYTSQQLERGEIFEAQLLQVCATIKSQLTELKTQCLKEDNAEKKVTLLNVFIGGLSSMEFPNPTRITLLGDLRYIISSVLLSLKY